MSRLLVRRGAQVRALEFTGTPLVSEVLQGANLAPAQPCGGRGTCGKCAVRLSGAVSAPNAAEERAGQRLSCQARLLGDAEVELPEARAQEIEVAGIARPLHLAPLAGRYGAAVDIGTTTLALRLYDLHSGAALGQASCWNPQGTVAADVMGRIGAALDGKGALLQAQVRGAIDELLRTACSGVCRPEEVETLVLAGNTTMLYLWSGRDPVSLSAAPFAADCLFGQMVEAQGRSAVLPPCMNAFVGADITCAVLASGLAESDRVAVLCDIGTNGEIALWKGGELLVTSTAAGPAFEGAGISCGCGSVPGAVDRVWLENGRIAARTIGGQAAVGVCGSGLIDAVAAYLQTGDIDETGATEEDTLPLRDGVALLPKDVRAVQLAKAAIAAGLETLLRSANLAPEDVDDLYIAGGFGSHLHIPSAVTIGLLPAALAAKARAIGNASLEGASRLLLSREEGEKARDIAARSRHVALGGNPMFNERYIENMMFESSDCD